jgi:hypothetical protein
MRNTAMAAMIASRTTPAAVARNLKAPSPEVRREADRRMAGPPSRIFVSVVIGR